MKQKIRCFLAVELPTRIQKKIEPLLKELSFPGIKPVAPENLHITIKFFGSISSEMLKQIEHTLSSLSCNPFSFSLKKIACFPNEKQPRVLWMGCESKELQQLAERANTILSPFFPLEEFTAHVTLARVKELKYSRKHVLTFITKHKNVKFGSVFCKEIVIKKSQRHGTGSFYTTYKKLPLMKEKNNNKSTEKKQKKAVQRKLLAIGAEAMLFREKNKVIKKRVQKSYRITAIDERLRSARTRREVKVLEKLSDLSFTPLVLFSDNKEIIEIEHLQGKKLADCLEQQDFLTIGNELGKKIRMLHDRGIIHGDLTTSNMLLTKSGVYFIDFGLSFFSQKIEDKAVDLHVLEEALESKHHRVSKRVFAAVKEAYEDKEVLQRLLEVELRGRNKKGS